MKQFLSLNKDETIMLYSLQNYLIKRDLEKEENLDKKVIKKLWLKKWQNGIINFLKVATEDKDILLVEKYEDIINYITINNIPLYKRRIFLIEILSFYPYFVLEDKDNNQYKGLRLNKNHRKSICEDIAEDLELQRSEVNDIEALYKSSYNFYTEKMKNTVIKVASIVGAGVLFASGAWMFAPSITPILTTAGLTGAAAISAGLAVLGGGSLTAGSMGITDGTVVLVCGGGILGCTSEIGNGVCMDFLKNSPEYTLVQVIKLECALKYIFILNEEENLNTSSDDILDDVIEKINITKDNLIEEASKCVEKINKDMTNKKVAKEEKGEVEKIKKSILILDRFINRYQYR